jgi:hypothetical protein
MFSNAKKAKQNNEGIVSSVLKKLKKCLSLTGSSLTIIIRTKLFLRFSENQQKFPRKNQKSNR